ncbi:hypothetical protein KAU55_00495 [Candidatus Bathyarchaeota archaeon]|nr:hypothetical protein [Candidatus Bathyarchaeota archaeon]
MSQPAGGKPREVLDLSRDPVKHFVRVNGWVVRARKRLDRLWEQEAKREYGLRYFTLCGKDGIDIFLFHREELIKGDGRGFPSVFYCESYYPSFAELIPILGRTTGKRREFEDLIRQLWFQRRIRESPFDIVNLDFSGCCFPRADHPFSTTLKSIYSLVELQKGHGFDFFVTFKALRSDENAEAIKQLFRNMKRNFEQETQTEGRFQERFDGITLEQLLERDYGRFLLSTFPKIIFGFGSEHGFIVSCPQKFLYRRQSSQGRPYQMIKFLFLFEPIEVPENFANRSRRSEELARSYKESILTDLDSSPIDVDHTFQEHPELNNQLKEDCEGILASRKPFGL